MFQAVLVGWFLAIPTADVWLIGLRDSLSDWGNGRATIYVLTVIWAFALALFASEIQDAPLADDESAALDEWP